MVFIECSCGTLTDEDEKKCPNPWCKKLLSDRDGRKLSLPDLISALKAREISPTQLMIKHWGAFQEALNQTKTPS